MPPESGSGNPGTNNAGDPGRGAGERDNAVVAEMRQFLRELDKQTNQSGKEREILDKNFKLRRKLAIANDQIAALEAKVPTDGTVVLSKEDAAEFDAFKKLNLKAAELTTIVKEHGELKTKVAANELEELLVDAADALGFENLPLFMRTMTREGLHLEFQDVTERDEESGKMVTAQVPMVRPNADDKAKLEPLTEYLEREIPELVEALQLAPGDEEEEGGGESRIAGEEPGVAAFTRRARTAAQGDRDARRSAGLPATAGVRMPVTRNARPAAGAGRDQKRLEQERQEKARNPAYAAL